jgi:hypothetical protein
MQWVEFLAIVAFFFGLECLTPPAIVPDHSRRQRPTGAKPFP